MKKKTKNECMHKYIQTLTVSARAVFVEKSFIKTWNISLILLKQECATYTILSEVTITHNCGTRNENNNYLVIQAPILRELNDLMEQNLPHVMMKSQTVTSQVPLTVMIGPRTDLCKKYV